MRLLFICEKLHDQHAFVVLWIEAFVARGYDVTVICMDDQADRGRAALGERQGELPFQIHSMGKERGRSKAGQAARFCQLISSLRYDRVLVHMAPVWGLLGAWWWIPRRTPVYLWYTHYQMEPGIWLLGHYGRRLFCATPQSLPQYDGSPKKVVTGHGIDLGYWHQRDNHGDDPHRLLCVHRLSRSKRVEILLAAMARLPSRYTLDVYGGQTDPSYFTELEALRDALELHERVTFHGTVPARDLPGIYTTHRMILNMAPETIDKSMLEAMTCGCYPVVTPRNAAVIGLSDAPQDEPGAVADFVQRHAAHPPMSPERLFETVRDGHGLDALVAKLDAYIRPAR